MAGSRDSEKEKAVEDFVFGGLMFWGAGFIVDSLALTRGKAQSSRIHVSVVSTGESSSHSGARSA